MKQNNEITREEMLNDMTVQRSKAEQLCKQYNELFAAGEFKKAGELEDGIKDAIKAHNKAARAVYAYDALAADNPLLSVVSGFTYQIIKTKSEKQDDGTPVLSINTVSTRFDITSFNRAIWSRIAADPSAFFKLEALCFCCTKETASGLGYSADRFRAEIGDGFHISDDGKAIKLEVSNTKLTAALRTVIGAMLGEEFAKKVIGADTRFFKEAFSTYDWRKSTLKTASLKQIGFIITDICHRVVTEGTYDIQTKMVKAPK